jgi:sigma-E factor negative regulatory protein RseC
VIERGIVLERRSGGELLVEVARSAACDGCHAQGGCAMALGDRRVQVEAWGEGVGEGDEVRLELGDRTFLMACVVVYAMPLAVLVLGAVAGALLATVLGRGPDALAAIGALAGAGAGLLLAGRLDTRLRRRSAERFRVVATAATGGGARE